MANQTKVYQIKLEGQLGEEWAPWFGDVTITWDEERNTLLTCRVIDQAALFGLLRKVRDLGLPLISVQWLHANQPFGNNQSEKRP